MRILFFGLPLAALFLLHDGHEIVHAAICRSDSLGLRRLKRLLGEDKVSVLPNIPAAFMLKGQEPELLVSWFWTKKLAPEYLAIPSKGTLGIHPSLLPRHRGPDPFFWAIDSGDEKTGVTAHRLASAYDTGAILASRSIALESHWNASTLAKKLDQLGLTLLREMVSKIARGQVIAEINQEEGFATEAPFPDDKELELNWNWPSDRLLRRIRAGSYWPGSYTWIGETCFFILDAEEGNMAPAVEALKPGELVSLRSGIWMKTGDSALRILKARDFGSETSAAFERDHGEYMAGKALSDWFSLHGLIPI